MVAYEPALPELLPDAERDAALSVHADLEESFRREGLFGAMRATMAASGSSFDDRESDVELARPDPQAAARRAANMRFSLTHDAGAAHRHKPDIELLKHVATRIVPAAGETSGDAWPRRSALALADRLGIELQEFPGNHSGPLLHPRAFAKRLREILNS